MSVVDRPQITVPEAAPTLRGEVLRLRERHGANLGRTYRIARAMVEGLAAEAEATA
jgi:hypothetical protein